MIKNDRTLRLCCFARCESALYTNVNAKFEFY